MLVRHVLGALVALCFLPIFDVRAQPLKACSSYLSFHGGGSGEIRTFQTSDEAHRMAERIVLHVGLAPNFVVSSGNVANAAAIVCDEAGSGRRRYIVYSPDFMRDIQARTASYWSLISILAHEIGHHANSHLLAGGSSGHRAELEADYFSGFVLAKMNATLEQALAAMSMISSNLPSASHPGRAARLVAIESGWREARGSSAPTTVPPPSTAGTSIRIQPNTFVEGEGFSTYRGSTRASCSNACAGDSRCNMFEFFKPEQKCNLYAHTRTAGASINADVGVKVTAAAKSPAGSATAGFSEHPGTFVDGEGYTTHRPVALDECRRACGRDTRCRMFEFHGPERKCNFYAHTMTAGRAADSHVGIKQ